MFQFSRSSLRVSLVRGLLLPRPPLFPVDARTTTPGLVALRRSTCFHRTFDYGFPRSWEKVGAVFGMGCI